MTIKLIHNDGDIGYVYDVWTFVLIHVKYIQIRDGHVQSKQLLSCLSFYNINNAFKNWLQNSEFEKLRIRSEKHDTIFYKQQLNTFCTCTLIAIMTHQNQFFSENVSSFLSFPNFVVGLISLNAFKKFFCSWIQKYSNLMHIMFNLNTLL